MSPTDWDPLSRNPFRLLGLTREANAATPPEPIFQCPGLEPLEDSPEVRAWAVQALQRAEDFDFHRCTWFDASRPLDQRAYQDLRQGRLQEAWVLWEQDQEPASRHNLAILSHLRWLFQPQDPSLLLDCALRWRELARHSPDRGYAEVLRRWLEFNRNLALRSLSQGDAAQLRRCWTLAAALEEPETLEAQQRELLSTELQRWDLELAGLRQALLEDRPAAQVAHHFERGCLGMARFLLDAVPENSSLAASLRQQLGLFQRSLARAWHRQSDGAPAGLSHAELHMEQALALLTGAEQTESRSELEHWRLNRQPLTARPVEVVLLPPPEPRTRLWLGLALTALAVLALLWAGSRPRQPFLDGMTRPAAQQRAEQIVEEISPIAARLADIRQLLQEEGGRNERFELLQEQGRLKKRHQELRQELERLQAWLQTHP